MKGVTRPNGLGEWEVYCAKALFNTAYSTVYSIATALGPHLVPSLLQIPDEVLEAVLVPTHVPATMDKVATGGAQGQSIGGKLCALQEKMFAL